MLRDLEAYTSWLSLPELSSTFHIRQDVQIFHITCTCQAWINFWFDPTLLTPGQDLITSKDGASQWPHLHLVPDSSSNLNTKQTYSGRSTPTPHGNVFICLMSSRWLLNAVFNIKSWSYTLSHLQGRRAWGMGKEKDTGPTVYKTNFSSHLSNVQKEKSALGR